jgi:two-component system sensor histidine kinase and response regulator WspE
MSEGDFSLLDLFREEVRSHTATLSAGLLELEASASPQKIEPLMRAAHSIKGAARIVGLDAAVGLAHVLEDAFVAAGQGRIAITPADVDVFLQGTDLLAGLAQITEATAPEWGRVHQAELTDLNARIAAIAAGQPSAPPPPSAPAARPVEPAEAPAPPKLAVEEAPPASAPVPVDLPALPEGPIVPGEDHPLFDLFREEVRSQTVALVAGLQVLAQPGAELDANGLAQAVHSIKGAARLVGVGEAAELAGALEDAFAAAGQGELHLRDSDMGALSRALRAFAGLVGLGPEGVAGWQQEHEEDIREVKTYLQDARSAGTPAPAPALALEPVGRKDGAPARMPVGPVMPAPEPAPALPAPVVTALEEAPKVAPEPSEAVVRVTAQSLNRLMSLAGESLVQARWLQPFSTALQKLKKHQDHLAALLDSMAQALTEGRRLDAVEGLIGETRKQAATCRTVLGERISEFDDHAAAAEDLNTRLYREVIVSRMRPFSDGAHGFPRLVRDMARRLDRQVRLDIDGLSTEVDRDILDKLEAPLTHLLRNSIDHGIEPPEVRRAAGKPEQGVIRLEVRHRAGMLAITVSDDGSGIDVEKLRRKIVERGLTTTEMAAAMGEAELLEFLFLPGFSTAQAVTEYSGRGVGLDVVQTTIRKVGGSVRISTRRGQGTTFHLQLPITLSVLRAVLVEVAGECYAFPHNRIDRLLRVPRETVRSLEHRQFVTVDGQNVGLVVAGQMFDLESRPSPGDASELPVLLMSDETGQYGLIVEAFRGEQDLVVRPLDARLGKVQNISAAAILDDGSPVLIADVEDMIRSMDLFIQSGSLRRTDEGAALARRKKHILVVDDSITVREVERQLLRHAGYEVSVAVDGKDGWNQLRFGRFDLVVTDVDMPRMNGLDLVRAIRDHEGLREVPIVIVSYKDRDEDRLRGLELGANSYMTKSSFHDDTFLRAVADLIGEP